MNTPTASRAALDGVRVLDLSSIVFGPYASQILADYGADVIKVEAPPYGDSTRNTGPSLERGLSAIFLGINRNKRSVVLDLKRKEALDALLRLVDTVDVFMHSIRPQKMKRLGLDPDTLLKRNPRLIYVGLHGFGQDGAYAGQPAYDDIIQGLSGVADVVAQQTGTPRYFPTIAADKTCALIAAHGVLAALFQREHTGEGQFVEVPMFEAMTSYMLVEHFYGHHLPKRDARAGYPRILSEWRRPYATTDGYVCLMPYTDQHWEKFFKAIGRPELGESDKYATIAARTQNINELYELLGRIVAKQTTAHWLKLFEQLEIPASRINALQDLESDPHLQSVNFFQDITDDANNCYRFTRNPVHLQNSHVDPSMPPRLGQHNHDIFHEAGLTDEEIQLLYDIGATLDHTSSWKGSCHAADKNTINKDKPINEENLR